MENNATEQSELGQNPMEKIPEILISVEGEITEIQYFLHLEYLLKIELDRDDISIVPFCSEIGLAPPHVLECMKQELSKRKLEPPYEAWLLIDRNSCSDTQLDELQNWADRGENSYFAISNPCFEYWLLLHFEDGSGIRKKVTVFNDWGGILERNLTRLLIPKNLISSPLKEPLNTLN